MDVGDEWNGRRKKEKELIEMFLSFKREKKWRQNICTFASLCLTFCLSVLSVCPSVRCASLLGWGVWQGEKIACGLGGGVGGRTHFLDESRRELSCERDVSIRQQRSGCVH